MALGNAEVTEWPIPRPLNCDPKLVGTCPNCGLTHLRPGYCMALDPMNAANSPANSDPVSTPVSKDRKAYMRDLMRAKRAAAKGGYGGL